MRFFLTMLSVLFSIVCISAQNGKYWADIAPGNVYYPENALLEKVPVNHRLLSLDYEQLKNELANAPMEFTAAAKNSPVTITLPMPDGSYEVFEVVESPSMMPALAAKFPGIKSFAGTGKNINAKTRFDYSVNGIMGSIEYKGASVYLLPAATEQTQYYVCYYKHDIEVSDEELMLSCGATPGFLEENAIIKEELQNPEHDHIVTSRDVTDSVELRTYRIAITATGEYTAAHGGTTESVMASFNTAVNRLNLFLGIDCDVKFLLVDNTENLIFFDPATDPFDINALASTLTGINQSTVDLAIGTANYDVAHLFQQGACFSVNDDGNIGPFLAGQAGGRVCTANGKARGIICFTGSVISVADNTMTHEMAHQFASGHTWNNCPGIQSQYASSSAFEPGSGSTIMSYSGSCGNQNINSFGINYFNIGSIVEVTEYSQLGTGSLCANVVKVGNHAPEVTLPYTNGFQIPISTPFQLTGSATDEDGEILTYCWEQYDLGPYGPMGSPLGDAPLFRSFPPSEDGDTRIFPNINAVIANQVPISEYLPDYTRNLTFRLTVRDNNMEAGGTTWEEVKFKSTASAGPFLVNYPNTAGLSLESGAQEMVTWDVANTDNGAVNCQVVNILLSVDGGFTYPFVLACSTPNDGEEMITIPNTLTDEARIKVEAADNIFFDISNNDFNIVAATEPGFSIMACDQFQQICIPDEVTIDISTTAFMGFDSLITLEIVEGLPMGVVPEFATNPMMAGNNTTVKFDMTSIDTDGNFEVLLRATAPNADTMYQTLRWSIVYNDFSELAVLTPADGATGESLGPDFTWIDLPHADRYDFEIATNPSFSSGTLIESVSNLTEANYTLTVPLEDNTIYYWRIRPSNECGRSDFLIPAVFSTFSTSCNEYANQNGTTSIGAGQNSTATASISISDFGAISDVNVINVRGEYDAVPDLQFILQSPAGTEVLLMEGICGNTSIYNIAFDDETVFPAGTDCPPTNGVAYQPFGNLSDFDGENTQGTWKMKIKVISNLGSGGYMEDWKLEFCANFEPNSPFVVNNNIAPVQPLGNRRISTPNLLVEDMDNGSWELDYVIVDGPAHGYLTLDGVILNVGDIYNQADLDWADVRYYHTDASQEIGDTDEFYFIVKDGTGGWLETTKFTLILDENVATSDVDISKTVGIYPNPTQDNLNIAFNQPLSNVVITVADMQGRILGQEKQQNLSGTIEMSTADLADGIYFLTIQTEGTIFTKKFAVQR